MSDPARPLDPGPKARLRAALELLARHINPPHQPWTTPIPLVPLTNESPLRLDDLDQPAPLPHILTGAWLRGLDLDALPARAQGCTLGEAEAAAPSQGPAPDGLGHTRGIHALAVLPDGRFLSAGNDKTVRLWQIGQPKAVAVLQGHSDWVRALAVLPDGRFLSAGSDHTVRLWQVGQPEAVAVFQGHSDWVRALAVFPDGRFLSAGDDHTVRLWQAGQPAAIAVFQGQTDRVHALAVLPDGRFLSAGLGKAVRLWQVGQLEAVAVLQGHPNWVLALAVLPDGRFLSAGDDHTVRLWQVGQPQAIAVFQGHPDRILALAMLPDGRFLSAGGDMTLRLWQVGQPEAVAVFQGHSNTVLALAVLPDGRFLSAGVDGTVRLWDVERGCLEIHTPRGEVNFFAHHEQGLRYTRADGQPWQVAQVQGKGKWLPNDELLYRHTCFLDAQGQTQPAWKYPELIEWEDDYRTFRLNWPAGFDVPRYMGWVKRRAA